MSSCCMWGVTQTLPSHSESEKKKQLLRLMQRAQYIKWMSLQIVLNAIT